MTNQSTGIISFLVIKGVTHPKVLEPKVLDPKVLVTKVLGSSNKGINWLYPVSDVKSLIGFRIRSKIQIKSSFCRGRDLRDSKAYMVTHVDADAGR